MFRSMKAITLRDIFVQIQVLMIDPYYALFSLPFNLQKLITYYEPSHGHVSDLYRAVHSSACLLRTLLIFYTMLAHSFCKVNCILWICHVQPNSCWFGLPCGRATIPTKVLAMKCTNTLHYIGTIPTKVLAIRCTNHARPKSKLHLLFEISWFDI